MNAQQISDILDELKVDKSGKILGKNRANDKLLSLHSKVIVDIKTNHISNNNFNLSKSDRKIFDKSKNKTIKFECGNGIGVIISYLNDKGMWVDLTDYDKW